MTAPLSWSTDDLPHAQCAALLRVPPAELASYTDRTLNLMRIAAQGSMDMQRFVASNSELRRRNLAAQASVAVRQLPPSTARLVTLLREADRRLATLAVYDAAVFDQQPQGTPSLREFHRQVADAIRDAEQFP